MRFLLFIMSFLFFVGGCLAMHFKDYSLSTFLLLCAIYFKIDYQGKSIEDLMQNFKNKGK